MHLKFGFSITFVINGRFIWKQVHFQKCFGLYAKEVSSDLQISLTNLLKNAADLVNEFDCCHSQVLANSSSLGHAILVSQS